MFFLLYQVTIGSQPARSVAFSEFMNDVRQHHVVEVRVKDRELTYRRVLPSGAIEQRETLAPSNWELQREILAQSDPQHPIQVHNEKDEGSGLLTSVVLTWLPMLFLVAMFVFFMRQLQSGGGKAMSFGKSRARLVNDAQNKVTFADVAGIDEAKDEVEEIIAFLKDPKKFRRLGGRIPKGVLLAGAPGTGKTLLARAIAGEAGVPFFTISGSDFVEMFVGVGASRVRDLFEQGKKHAPCIIFIDEIDAVGRHRGAGLGGGHDEREQTLNQLLVEMDGFDASDGVIIIAATNRPDVLDPALLRPGRFDRRITVPRPDVRGREEILRVHTRKVPLSPDVDLAVIARSTPGFAGAEMENLVNEAALLAARQDKDAVSMADFELAKDKVLMGVERKNMVMSEEERKVTAWHEAGHALVSHLIAGNDPVHKVSIIPRGPALGVTMHLPVEDRYTMSQDQALARIAMMMGGRVAEELAFQRVTTGASDDIKRATRTARRMVCDFGMSARLGPVFHGESEDQPFLGRDFGHMGRDYSEQTAIAIDEEVRRIITDQYQRALAVLMEKRDILDRFAEALLDRETLDAEEVMAIFDGRPLPVRVKTVIPSWSDRRDKTKEGGRSRTASIFPPPRGVPSGA
ncbi:MAG: ATP-dependent zinc metalloprotease FtsH [Deltaproteobacteria bacterium]|nr:ATP-dependent zinc metalloprotease FtsH [Deltaproteobacteria bacterium]